MKFFLITYLILSIPALSNAQELYGRLISAESQEPIAFANIGISGTTYGTYSDEEGYFSLDKDWFEEDSSVLIRAIGFENRDASLKGFLNSDTLLIKLETKIYELKEITATADRVNSVRIGKRKLPPQMLGWGFSPGFADRRKGKAVAILVKPNKRHLPVYFYEASIAVFENAYPEGKFRVRFMSVHPETNEPHKDLSTVSYIKEFGEKEGWVTFNLEDSQYINQDKIYVVFENLNDDMSKMDRNQSDSPFPLFLIHGFMLGKDKILISNASLQGWEEHKEDLVFRLRYSYEKK